MQATDAIRTIVTRYPALLRQLIEVLKPLRAGKRVANTALFHTGRCGSTVLGNLLGQHPDVYWAGEIFEGVGHDYSRVIKQADGVRLWLQGSMYRYNAKFYGFETKFLSPQHLAEDIIDMPLQVYVPFLRDLGFTHFIVLERRNYLRQAISGQVGRATGGWHRGTNAKSATKVAIDIDNVRIRNEHRALLEHFRSVAQAYTELEALLARDRCLKLVYEDDILENPIIAYRKVTEFLGIDTSTQEPTVTLERINPFPVPEMLTNFDEVAALLEGTPYEWMLSD